MPSHLLHRHGLGQAECLRTEIEVPLRPAVAAMHLQQLPLADRHRLESSGSDFLRLLALF
jgi:hypothetical protein